jgi:hypothetical protein
MTLKNFTNPLKFCYKNLYTAMQLVQQQSALLNFGLLQPITIQKC